MLTEVTGINTAKYLAGNNDGEIVNVTQLYNLNREAKISARKKRGVFTEKELVNILNAVKSTQEKDLEARKVAKITSKKMPGVVRRFALYPTLNLYIHSRASLILMGELADMGRLVLAEDATGELWDLVGTSLEGKIHHTIMTMQATECLLHHDDAKNWGNCLIRPYRFAERASNANTGSEYASWKRQLRQETREVTKELFGKEMDPIPIAVKFDCAMELANGTILGYREEGQVDTGKMYANVVFLLLLRHEHMTKNVTEAKELKRCAVITLDRIKSICVCLMKQCDSHVYRAMRDQRKI